MLKMLQAGEDTKYSSLAKVELKKLFARKTVCMLYKYYNIFHKGISLDYKVHILFKSSFFLFARPILIMDRDVETLFAPSTLQSTIRNKY